MKVCIIVHDYLPESTRVTAKMMHELAIEFNRVGHEVTVITPGHNLKQGYKKIIMDGVSIIKFKSGLINTRFKFMRLINESLLSIRAWYYLKKELESNPHEIIVFWTPSVFWGPLVRKLKKIWVAKTFLLLRDFFPQWLFDSNQLKRGSIIAHYFQHFEQVVYSVSDKIGLQSPNNLTWFRENINTRNELVLLYNWVSDSGILQSKNKYREKYNLKDKIIFFYGGNIGPAQDLMTIMRLAVAFQSIEEAHFLLVGAGYDFDKITEFISKEKLKNVTLLPAVSQEEFLEMLSESDIGLLCLNKLHTTHNFPGKLLNYLVQGKPVLGVINPGNDLKEVVESIGCGYISVAGDDEILYENALTLMSKELRQVMGKKSRELLKQKFTIEQAVQTIIGALQ